MFHNFDTLATFERQYVELDGFIDKSCDSALARHEREVHVAFLVRTVLTGPFCVPPAVAAGAYCGWFMLESSKGDARSLMSRRVSNVAQLLQSGSRRS
jgi:hypothetical protein